MAELHNRMPVILDPETFDWWMTGSTEEVGQLLMPCPSEMLKAYPISRQVNNPRNEGAGLLRPGTSSCPHSSECVEGKFFELRIRDPA